MEREELPLLHFGQRFDLGSESSFQLIGRLRTNCEKWSLTKDPSALRYIETSDETFAFSGDVLDFEKGYTKLCNGIGAAKPMFDAGVELGLVWLRVIELEHIKNDDRYNDKPAHRI